MTSLAIDHAPAALPRSASAIRTGATWDALERFISALQEGRQVPDQYRLALSAICESTGAQLAFLYSDQMDRVLEMVGGTMPTPQWCCEMCRRIGADRRSGEVWNFSRRKGAPAPPSGPEPFAVAVLPVELPRPAWLFAVTFDRGKPLQPSDLRVMRVIWKLQTGHNRHVVVYDKLKETLFGVVRCLSTAIDAKDPYTCGHSERVARIAVRLGEEMKLSRGEISDLYLAGLLHDVGKIGIRDDVLLKEGPLTPEEFDHVKQHSVLGERILSNVTRLAYLAPGVRGHHERFDGGGYPDGLAGESIPLMARILAVADSCDAMMSARRYRDAIPPARIEPIMQDGAGTQWDPCIVEIFFACRHDLYAVCQRGLGQSVYTAVERAAGRDAGEQGSRRSAGLAPFSPPGGPGASPTG